MSLTLAVGKCTLLGNYRENNEDSIEDKQYPDLAVYLVADGMGGQAAGEIASKKATEVVPKELRNSVKAGVSEDQVKTAVRKAIVQANEQIIAMGQLDREMKNMGTTVVVAVFRKGNELFVAGVGDSRAYLVRDKKIEQLTVDHSLAQALVEAKTISPAEAREHRFKNVLWKYLGSREVGEGPEVKAVPLQAGDRFLLCTDGLSGVVADEKLLEFILGQTDMQVCAEKICDLALESGSKDNVSVVMIEAVAAR